MDWNIRSVSCVVCGKNFSDDCGDSFCSSYCEKQYEKENEPCSRCGDEVGEDNLNYNGLCESCEEEEDEG